MATYYLPNGQAYTGDTHVMDGVRMSGGLHTTNSEILIEEKSNSNPQIVDGRSPLQTMCMQALRRYGEFSPGTVDGDVLLMFIDFANMVIDDIRMHPYAPTKAATNQSGNAITVPVSFDYYVSLSDTRDIDDIIIVQGLLYHYAMQQGSDKLQMYMPMYHRTLNQQLWRGLNGYTVRYKEKTTYDLTEPYANLELLNINNTGTSYE
tara:strand:- start:1119 stop:1736 length:618 start_codon:yes stop_codon:yes gene_type:complete